MTTAEPTEPTGKDSKDTEAEMLASLSDVSRQLAEAELRATRLRTARDYEMRACRAAGISIPRIARAADTSDTTVKSVVRSTPRA